MCNLAHSSTNILDMWGPIHRWPINYLHSTYFPSTLVSYKYPQVTWVLMYPTSICVRSFTHLMFHSFFRLTIKYWRMLESSSGSFGSRWTLPNHATICIHSVSLYHHTIWLSISIDWLCVHLHRFQLCRLRSSCYITTCSHVSTKHHVFTLSSHS